MTRTRTSAFIAAAAALIVCLVAAPAVADQFRHDAAPIDARPAPMSTADAAASVGAPPAAGTGAHVAPPAPIDPAAGVAQRVAP